MRWPIWGAVGTVVVHLGAGAFIALIPKDAGRKASLIAVVEKKKRKDERRDEDKQAKAEEPPPPPKAVQAPRPKPKPAVENTPPPPPSTPPPSAAAAAHPALAALPDLGISLAGGPGGGGIAVPAGPAGGDHAAAKAPDGPRAAAIKPRQEDCADPDVKPKSVPIAQGGVIAAAQAAGVEGRIRLELQIDESGNVTSVRVISGLGGAIDAAAVAAAKRAKVSPITRCGRPVAGRLVYAMTIRNPD
jgi:protein TonB